MRIWYIYQIRILRFFHKSLPPKQGAGRFAGRAILLLSEPGIPLSPRPNPPFRLHQVDQNIVDAGQVPFAFGTQPIEHQRIETDAHRNLPTAGALQIITLPRRTIEAVSRAGIN